MIAPKKQAKIDHKQADNPPVMAFEIMPSPAEGKVITFKSFLVLKSIAAATVTISSIAI